MIFIKKQKINFETGSKSGMRAITQRPITGLFADAKPNLFCFSGGIFQGAEPGAFV